MEKIPFILAWKAPFHFNVFEEFTLAERGSGGNSPARPGGSSQRGTAQPPRTAQARRGRYSPRDLDVVAGDGPAEDVVGPERSRPCSGTAAAPGITSEEIPAAAALAGGGSGCSL